MADSEQPPVDLEIDTTNSPPARSAQLIAEHFALPPARPTDLYPTSESSRALQAAIALTAGGRILAAEGMTVERQLDPGSLGDHIDRLYRAARGFCGSREEAEDLVQDTFVRVLRKPRVLRSEDDIGYLLRVLRNTFISQRRTAARRPRTTPLPDELDYMADRTAVQPESRIDTNALYAAISELPGDFRDALIAIDIVGLSYREAALALRAHEGTVTTRLYRARQRVAQLLSAEESADATSASSDAVSG